MTEQQRVGGLGGEAPHAPSVPSPLVEVEAAEYPSAEHSAEQSDDGTTTPSKNNDEQNSNSNTKSSTAKDVIGGHMVATPPRAPALSLSTKVGPSADRNGQQKEVVKPVARDEDYALLYASALVTGQLGVEIERVEREIEGLVGVLDDSRW